VSRFTAGTAGGPHRIPVIYQGESTAGSAVEAGHQQKPQVSWLEFSHTPRVHRSAPPAGGLAAVLDHDGQQLSATQTRQRALADDDHLAVLHAIWTAETAPARERRYRDLLLAALPSGQPVVGTLYGNVAGGRPYPLRDVPYTPPGEDSQWAPYTEHPFYTGHPFPPAPSGPPWQQGTLPRTGIAVVAYL